MVQGAGCAAHVLRVGLGKTGLSLSPTRELLATMLANHCSIFLWADHLIFRHGATDLAPSDVPVNAELPLLVAGAALAPLDWPVPCCAPVLRCHGSPAV